MLTLFKEWLGEKIKRKDRCKEECYQRKMDEKEAGRQREEELSKKEKKYNNW